MSSVAGFAGHASDIFDTLSAETFAEASYYGVKTSIGVGVAVAAGTGAVTGGFSLAVTGAAMGIEAGYEEAKHTATRDERCATARLGDECLRVINSIGKRIGEARDAVNLMKAAQARRSSIHSDLNFLRKLSGLPEIPK